MFNGRKRKVFNSLNPNGHSKAQSREFTEQEEKEWDNLFNFPSTIAKSNLDSGSDNPFGVDFNVFDG